MMACAKCKRNDLVAADFPAGEKRLLNGERQHSWCKKCQCETTKIWRSGNRERLRKYSRERHHTHREYLHQYGITKLDYDKMFEAQDGCCAICGSRDPGRKTSRYFCVDHDHITKKVRGLLCNNCNVALGRFKDNLEMLRRAVVYLEQYQEGDLE